MPQKCSRRNKKKINSIHYPLIERWYIFDSNAFFYNVSPYVKGGEKHYNIDKKKFGRDQLGSDGRG